MIRIPSSLAATSLCLLVWAMNCPAIGAGDAEVRVYTNADLERFPVLPDSDVEISNPTAEEWQFVTDYLRHQYTRLDADRDYSLERERAEAEVDLLRRRANRRTYGLPVYWNGLGRWRRVPGRHPGEGTVGRIKGAKSPDGSIRPLHAGPTRSQIDYFKATRPEAAAFPSSAGSRSGGGRKR